MTEYRYKQAFISMTIAAVILLVGMAYFYGENRGKKLASAPASTNGAASTRILLGHIVRIEPLHVYVESDAFGPLRTYDVLISPQTQIMQLVPWNPGERDQAVKERNEYLERLKPKSGEPIPPPLPPMKPMMLRPSELVPGMHIGVLATMAIDPEGLIIAATLRPLTPEEARAGQVANTFPL